MTKKVRIKRLPGNIGIPEQGSQFSKKQLHSGNDPEIKSRRTLQGTSREKATLEAEKGETVVTNLQGEGIPEFYRIGGKPHSRGGTPLDLPMSSFIFSKDKSLKIKDPEVLAMFGKRNPKKSGYTPAELSLSYDLNKYRDILLNPFSSRMERETAERMIMNYNMKLGALALAQESKKGFDRGIPKIAEPYMMKMGITAEDLLNAEAPTEEQLQTFKAGGQYTGKRKVRIVNLPQYDNGGQPSVGEDQAGFYERVYGQPINAFRQMVWDGQGWVTPQKFRKTVGELTPEMMYPSTAGSNKGSQPEISSRSTKTQNIPKGSVKWDPTKEGYDEKKVQAGDYILQDGSWKKVKGRKPTKFEGELYDDDRLGTFQEQYSRMHKHFSDPKMQDALIAKYRDVVKGLKPNKHLTQADITALQNATPEQIMGNFMEGQRRNMAFANKYGETSKYPGMDDKRKGKTTDQLHKEMGYDAMSGADTAIFQAAYLGAVEMAKDPATKDMLGSWTPKQVGVADEEFIGTGGKKNVSKIDKLYGDTTGGYMGLYADDELDLENVPFDEETKEKMDDTKHMPPPTPQGKTPFWTESKMDIYNALWDWAGATKGRPFTAMPTGHDVDPALVDFRGETYGLQAGAKGLIDKIATLGDTKAAGAMAANIMKNMIPGVLQSQGRQQRTNAEILNKFKMWNTARRDKLSRDRATLTTAQYDKEERARHNFENMKRALRNNVKEALKGAWTARGKTQQMNAMDSDFYTDPRTGYLHKVGPDRPIEPGRKAAYDFYDTAAGFKAENPDMTWDQAMKMAKQGTDDVPAGMAPQSWQYEGAQYPQRGYPGSYANRKKKPQYGYPG